MLQEFSNDPFSLLFLFCFFCSKKGSLHENRPAHSSDAQLWASSLSLGGLKSTERHSIRIWNSPWWSGSGWPRRDFLDYSVPATLRVSSLSCTLEPDHHSSEPTLSSPSVAHEAGTSSGTSSEAMTQSYLSSLFSHYIPSLNQPSCQITSCIPIWFLGLRHHSGPGDFLPSLFASSHSPSQIFFTPQSPTVSVSSYKTPSPCYSHMISLHTKNYIFDYMFYQLSSFYAWYFVLVNAFVCSLLISLIGLLASWRRRLNLCVSIFPVVLSLWWFS